MCGGCAGAPPDWAAEWVSGPRRRTLVARTMSSLMNRHTVVAVTAGWTVTSVTGAAVVCRTYDELVLAVSWGTGIAPDTVCEAGLAAVAQHLDYAEPARIST